MTYHGRPLYLFYKDAYVGPPVGVGTQGICGAGCCVKLTLGFGSE